MEGKDRPSLWKKALNRDTVWEKDEILDVLFWIRHVVALLIGCLFGLLQLTGLPGFILYISIWFTISQAYFKWFLDLDEDDFGGWGTVQQEAAWSSFALFLFTWIIVYTAVIH